MDSELMIGKAMAFMFVAFFLVLPFLILGSL